MTIRNYNLLQQLVFVYLCTVLSVRTTYDKCIDRKRLVYYLTSSTTQYTYFVHNQPNRDQRTRPRFCFQGFSIIEHEVAISPLHPALRVAPDSSSVLFI